VIRVIIVDDHALIRRGLRETLTEAGDISVVGEAGDYGGLRELLAPAGLRGAAARRQPAGRSGIDALKALADEGSTIRTVMLSQYPEDQYGIRALKAGAMAYLNKSAAPETIVAGGAQRRRGTQVRHPGDRAGARRRGGLARRRRARPALRREMQTLMLIAEGASSRRSPSGCRCRRRRSASTGPAYWRSSACRATRNSPPTRSATG